MNILFDARPLVDPTKGGVGRVALHLATAYARTFPCDTLVCVTTGTRTPNLPRVLQDHASVRHCHIAIPNKVWSIGCLSGRLSLIRETVRRFGALDAAFFPNLGFFGSLKEPPLPRTLLLHDLSFFLEPRWFPPKTRAWHAALRASALIQSFPRLLAVSETTKRDAIQLLHLPPERISVIPLGPTLPRETPPDEVRPSDVPSPSRSILALGARDPRKNFATARAAVSLAARDLRFHDLVIVTPPRQTSDDALAHQYRQASVFLYPSWYEGYGLPLHEAAQFGTPCIASTSGALPETAPRGTLFANPAKPHHWANALQKALDQPRPAPLQPDPTAWIRAAHLIRDSFIAL